MNTFKIAAAILIAICLSACAGPNVSDKAFREQYAAKCPKGGTQTRRCVDTPLWAVNYPGVDGNLWPGR